MNTVTKPTTTDTNNADHLMANYARQSVSFVRGDGCWLYDENDKAYLDGLCGISVTSLGHNHPVITAAIREQAGALLHTSNLFHIQWQSKLADLLTAQCQLSDADRGKSHRAFFANSGAEANEAAVKLARLYAHANGNDNPLIVTFTGSFHGRTMGMIAATAGDKIKQGFEPTLPGFLHLPFNDIAALEQAFTEHSNIAAVMLEPVQGEGGINIADVDFLNAIQKLCKGPIKDTSKESGQHQALIILDEIQSGNGRCGEYFAFNQFRKEGATIAPDIITTAKALGNGMPVGACIAEESIAAHFVPGKHGSTFGGNPICCRAACTVVEQIVDQQLSNKATLLGERLTNAFSTLANKVDGIKEIRHKGLMIGIELERDCAELVGRGLDAGIVINVTAGSVVRLLPPLIMSDDEADQLADKTCEIIEAFLNKTN